MQLGQIEIKRKTGQEKFMTGSGETDICLLEFWQWATSDLLNNSTRGILAEFLVATALGVNGGTRTEWDAYDITDKNGTKIEVKSSAYLQTWHQNVYSKITFDIKPTLLWNPDTNTFDGERSRQSDFYIFCLLHHKDQETVDPLDLDQWTFYILPTLKLDENLGTQKRISLSRLLKLKPVNCQFGLIRQELDLLNFRPHRKDPS